MKELLAKLEKLGEAKKTRENEIKASFPFPKDAEDIVEAVRAMIAKEDEALKNDAELKRIHREIAATNKAIHEQVFGLDINVEGPVTDKETAIQLLTQSSHAWKVLDDSLKSDPEVIMYYQPLGHRHIEYSDVNPEEIGICATEGSEDFCQEGFEPVSLDDWFQLLESGLISSEVYGALFYVRLVRPSITFPEGFDYEAYYKIQAGMNRHRIDDWTAEHEARKLFRQPKPTTSYVYSDETCVFDREFLPALVKELYKAPQTR